MSRDEPADRPTGGFPRTEPAFFGLAGFSLLVTQFAGYIIMIWGPRSIFHTTILVPSEIPTMSPKTLIVTGASRGTIAYY